MVFANRLDKAASSLRRGGKARAAQAVRPATWCWFYFVLCDLSYVFEIALGRAIGGGLAHAPSSSQSAHEVSLFPISPRGP
eukprot:2825011-Pyramimonas_sp.AAC.1